MIRTLALLFLFTVSPAFAAVGGQDSGGGNLVNGRPIETYALEPVKLPGFASLQPQLDKLRAARDTQLLLDAVLRKTWYFIPGPLSALPPERVGAVTAVEQGALQSFGEVWIDADLFEKMPAQEQATLILHEIVMGMRLYALDSPFSQCRVIWHEIFKADCAEESHETAGRPSDLRPEDYATIRRIVRVLLDEPDLDQADLLWLFSDGNFSFGDFTFRLPPKKPRPADLFQAFRTAQLSRSWPGYAYEQPEAVTKRLLPGQKPKELFPPTSNCQFRLQMDPAHESFSITIKSGHRAPYSFQIRKFRDEDAMHGAFTFYLDKKGRPTNPGGGAEMIGKKVTWLQFKLDRVGFEDGPQYRTQAELKAVRILKGVRVDEMTNDAIFNEQSLVCASEKTFGGF